jgi:DNA-binding CsgD family transcriptional regulator
MESAREIGYARVECISNRMAAEVCEELGDIPRSLHHYKVYFHYFRELENQNLRHKLTEGERQMERERIERENDAYRTKIAKLEEEMEGRQQELIAMALQVVKKDEFIDEIREQVVEYARSGRNMPTLATDLLRRMRVRSDDDDDQWRLFEGQFNRLYHGLTTVLLQRYHLTPTELKVCMLLRLGFATKEIADILHMAVHTVETHRRRVRKKLALPRNGNLMTFLASSDAGYSLLYDSGNATAG